MDKQTQPAEPNEPSSLKYDGPRSQLNEILDLRNERDRLKRINAVLLEALQDFESYLDDRADVIDGDYGQPKPNREMQLLGTVQLAILKASEGK